MNIHPLFVHFPVAFFLLYSILEIARFKKFRTQVYYFYVKAIVVIAGALASILTIITGIIAKGLYVQGSLLRHFINIHETFAITTAVYFGIIALLYLIGWLRRENILSQNPSGNTFLNFCMNLEKYITEAWFGVLFGFIGIALVSSTAALGGLIAWGPSNDPISGLLYSFLTHL